MTKDQLRSAIEKIVKSIWYERRSVNPIRDQTDFLTEEIWDRINSYKFILYFFEQELKKVQSYEKKLKSDNVSDDDKKLIYVRKDKSSIINIIRYLKNQKDKDEKTIS